MKMDLLHPVDGTECAISSFPCDIEAWTKWDDMFRRADVEPRVVPVDEMYTPEAIALLAEHHEWSLGRLERECEARGISALRSVTAPPSPASNRTP